MDEFAPFDNKLTGLIEALSPASRRSMAVDIAKKLRQRQQQRIKAQKAPDGSAYAPRKPQPIRDKKGRVKREMFAKLRTNRYLKARGDDNEAVVGFTGKVQRIARVHQLGLWDKVTTEGTKAHYPERILLGLQYFDKILVERVILDSLMQDE